MIGKWAGILVLTAATGFILYFENATLRPQPQTLTAQAAGAQSKYDTKAADSQCPQPSETAGYNKDVAFDAVYEDCGVTPPPEHTGQTASAVLAVNCPKKRNLYGKPCVGDFIKASCSKPNFCDGQMPKSECYNGKEWVKKCEVTKVAGAEITKPFDVAATGDLAGVKAPVTPKVPTPPIQGDTIKAAYSTDELSAAARKAPAATRIEPTIQAPAAPAAPASPAPVAPAGPALSPDSI